MGVFDKKLEMGIRVHVDDNWSIVDDVVVKVLQIFLVVTKLFNPFLKFPLFLKVKFLALFLHVDHCVNLQSGTSIERFVFCLVIKYLSLFASCYMSVILPFFKVLETVIANHL